MRLARPVGRCGCVVGVGCVLSFLSGRVKDTRTNGIGGGCQNLGRAQSEDRARKRDRSESEALGISSSKENIVMLK